jgi:hypothetical protein
MMKPLIGKGLQYLTASVDADNGDRLLGPS